MMENKFRCTNISENGNTGLFWLGKDNLSVYDIVRLLNELTDENEQLKEQLNDKEMEWLRNNTVWEQMPSNNRTITKTSMRDDVNMTKKYEIEYIGDMLRVLKDGEPLTLKFEKVDEQDVINLVKELNKLNEENEKLLIDCDNLIDDNTEYVVELNQDSKKMKILKEENIELKQILGNILIEVRSDIGVNSIGEVVVFINPKSYNMISNVLMKYGGVHRVGWSKSNERFIVNDNGILVDNVTKEMYNNVREIADILNYYEETCSLYEKIISELKDGTYKEPLPITSRK